MKKLSLLLVMVSVAFMTLAGNTSRPVNPEDIGGDEFHIYQRSTHGSAVNPVTHTYMVPQDGVMEITGWDGLSYAYIKNNPLEKEMATHSSILLPGKSYGQRRLVSYSPRSCTSWT